MKVQVRLSRPIYTLIRTDLARPHPFASERVGFATARLGNCGGDPLLLLVDTYAQVSDEHYIDDPTTGARINAFAIRGAMQLVLDQKCGVFHVHLHPHHGVPQLSRTDRRELPRLVGSLHNAGPSQGHGLLLLSDDYVAAFVWPPNGTGLVKASRVNLVGYPMELWE
jgi:hypothetical protein